MGTFDDLLREPTSPMTVPLGGEPLSGKRRLLFVLGDSATPTGDAGIDLRGPLRQATTAETALLIATHVLGQPPVGPPLRVRLPTTVAAAEAVTPWLLSDQGAWTTELVGEPDFTTVGSAQAWRTLRERRRDPLGKGGLGGALERVADELLSQARGTADPTTLVASLEMGLAKGEGPDEVARRLSLAPEELGRRLALDWTAAEPLFARLAAQGHGKLYQRWAAFLPQKVRPTSSHGVGAQARHVGTRPVSPAVQQMQRMLSGALEQPTAPAGALPLPDADRPNPTPVAPKGVDGSEDDDFDQEDSL